MTKEEIIQAMKDKYDIKEEVIKPSELKPCSLDDKDEDCLICGS